MPQASLLFAAGSRPGREAVRALAEAGSTLSVSFDPSADGAPADGGSAGNWLEILANGLTFDLTGLSPGPSAALPPARHAFGLPEDFTQQPLEALTLRPGAHLSGGARMIPVIRCLSSVTEQLAALPGVQAVAWHPARCWSAPQPFRAGVQRWIAGGAFPGFSLAALAEASDRSLHSEGLGLFIGQELRIEPELAGDRAAAGKLGLRLMHWLIDAGPLNSSETLAVPDGEQVRLEPSANGRFVRVWKA